MDIDQERYLEMDLDDMFEPPILNHGHSRLSSTTTTSLPDTLPFSTKIQSWKRRQLGDVWARQLDRVNVLGRSDHGHRGSVASAFPIQCCGDNDFLSIRCVNALSWAQNGECLISSGDDQEYVSTRPPSPYRSDLPIAVYECGEWTLHLLIPANTHLRASR